MKRVLTAAALGPITVIIVLWGPLWLLMLVAWAIAELALTEYLHLTAASGMDAPRWLVQICCTFLFLVGYWAPAFLLTALWLFAIVLLGVCSLRSPLRRMLADCSGGFFGLLYIAFPLVIAPLITARESGVAQLLFVFVVVWAGDIAALYVGRTFGRRLMAPVLSPKKTWEGAIASMIGGILAGVGLVALGSYLFRHGFSLLLFPQSWWFWVWMAIVLNIAAQIGDLLESAIKRGAGLKDSGTILPGHGGVLDRIDALLLAVPVMWYALLFR
jgi:phosphatidate cytidylyltransferase